MGFALCKLLYRAGARLVVAEPRKAVAARTAALFGAEIMTSHKLLAAEVDVFAPCGLGAVVDRATVKRLRAKVVCGAANNQLASPRQGAELAARDIVYCPDYVVNAGGIINVAAERLGWDQAIARERVKGIGARPAQVLDLADDVCRDRRSQSANPLSPARPVRAAGSHS